MFSKATEYALRATIYIAQKSTEEHKLSLKEIAHNIDSPISFTAKILQVLSRRGKIIKSGRGVNGGYYILEEARKLPISKVIIAMGEDGVILNCILGLPECSDQHPCPLHYKYKKLKIELFSMFEETTIEDLANDVNAQEKILNAVVS